MSIRTVNAISGRLSLRDPQRKSLEILDRVCEIVTLDKQTDPKAALEVIRSEYPTVAEFEREFPSLCFALATGVGKTRLMGAFISYLHLEQGLNDFFVLAPNLTIYNKLIADFTPNTPKYVFKGLGEFATEGVEVITGDNYEDGRGVRKGAARRVPRGHSHQRLQYRQDQYRGPGRQSAADEAAPRDDRRSLLRLPGGPR